MSRFTKKAFYNLLKDEVRIFIKDEIVSIILEQLGVILVDPTGGWITVLSTILRIVRYFRRLNG